MNKPPLHVVCRDQLIIKFVDFLDLLEQIETCDMPKRTKQNDDILDPNVVLASRNWLLDFLIVDTSPFNGIFLEEGFIFPFNLGVSYRELEKSIDLDYFLDHTQDEELKTALTEAMEEVSFYLFALEKQNIEGLRRNGSIEATLAAKAIEARFVPTFLKLSQNAIDKMAADYQATPDPETNFEVTPAYIKTLKKIK